MKRLALLTLLATALVLALAAQTPLDSGYHREDEFHHLDSSDEWSLDKVPNPNATDHLVFETVYSLLQHWPNTRMRNGHNIVPASIPTGTLLYRGSTSKELPLGPEWIATDPEHSYFFCRGEIQQGCWHLTLATTRPLKAVYFDGSSAAKYPYGSMDTQDLIAWGRPGNFSDENKRIKDLCEWGKKFGVDAFVRMEMDFEAMICDFTSGMSVVSFENLVTQLRADVLPSSTLLISFEGMNSGSWHNRFPGETRIQLDLTGLVSLYDTQLAPSLVAIRAGQERWDHRVQNISSKDTLAVKSRLEEILMRPETSSGIDWRTLVQVIVDRYSGRLELVRHLLNSSATVPDDVLDLANKTQSQLRIMLTPYILLSTTPTDPSDKDDLNWTLPVFELCATTHTRTMELRSMTGSEKLILQAVRGTTREICRVVTKMWAAGVYAGIDRLLNTKESPDIDISELTRVWNTWRGDLEHLMGWLDWGVWVKCNPKCGHEEMCYLPTWPWGGFPPFYKPKPHPPDDALHLKVSAGSDLPPTKIDMSKWGPDDWIRPQPTCVSRVDPYQV